MDKKTFFTLILICLLAFILRFYKVTEIPPSLNWDEVSIGYNAYSILKTGKDEWGEFLPLHFRAYGEYKLPVQIYASIPGITAFGLNELGVRITPVIYGTLTVLITFFLANAIFRSYLIAYISAFLLAISPWHIHLTRASFESSFSVFWVVLGLWFLIKGFKSPKWLIYSSVAFAISVYTYNSTRVFSPLFLLISVLIYKDQLFKFKKWLIIATGVFIILSLPLVPFFLSGESSARYKLVSITDDPGLIPRINENRGNSTLPSPLDRLAHNKITYLSFYLISNYMSHFSPQYLFITGAPHKQHHVQNIGQLYLFQAPLLFLGLYYLFKTSHEFKWLLISWLILIILPVSITFDSIPHALRTAAAAPFYQLVSAFGFYYLFKWINMRSQKVKIFALVASFVIVVISVASYLINYYTIYPKLYSRDWQYGYKQIVSFIKEYYQDYDQIVFSRHFGEPHMFTLFYLNYDPLKFQNDPNLVRFETYDWVRVLRFDKFHFPDLGDEGSRYKDIISKNPGKKMLFVGKPGDFPENLPRLLIVNFLNGDKAFEIVEDK